MIVAHAGQQRERPSLKQQTVGGESSDAPLSCSYAYAKGGATSKSDRLPEFIVFYVATHTGRVLWWIDVRQTGAAAYIDFAGSGFSFSRLRTASVRRNDLSRLEPVVSLSHAFSVKTWRIALEPLVPVTGIPAKPIRLRARHII